MYPVIQIRSQILKIYSFLSKLLRMIVFNAELFHSPRHIIIIVTCQEGPLWITILFPGVVIGNRELTSIQLAVF